LSITARAAVKTRDDRSGPRRSNPAKSITQNPDGGSQVFDALDRQTRAVENPYSLSLATLSVPELALSGQLLGPVIGAAIAYIVRKGRSYAILRGRR
jgi:hypothetical protein